MRRENQARPSAWRQTCRLGDERSRAHALGSLAPQLSPEQKTKTLAEALAAAKGIGHEQYRAEALGSLAPQLRPDLATEALAAAKAIGFAMYRTHALRSLAPPSRLPASSLRSAPPRSLVPIAPRRHRARHPAEGPAMLSARDRGALNPLQRHECCLLIGERIGRCATPA
jgi:hypothetical protein